MVYMMIQNVPNTMIEIQKVIEIRKWLNYMYPWKSIHPSSECGNKVGGLGSGEAIDR